MMVAFVKNKEVKKCSISLFWQNIFLIKADALTTLFGCSEASHVVSYSVQTLMPGTLVANPISF